MKPESKKNRGKCESSSSSSSYDLSNLAEALDGVAASDLNPTESSPSTTVAAANKDGGGSKSAYDFGDLSKELSTIDHEEKTNAALRIKNRRKMKRMLLFKMRHAFPNSGLCPPQHILSAMLASIDGGSIGPPRYVMLRNHPLVDFPLHMGRIREFRHCCPVRVVQREKPVGGDVPVVKMEDLKEDIPYSI